jgi:outer membrane protein insertion porin family
VDEFDEINLNRRLHFVNGLVRLSMIWLSIILPLNIFGLLNARALLAEEKGAVAVLPFKVYSLNPLEHWGRLVQETLTLAIGKRGYRMISPAVINTHPLAVLPELDVKDVLILGKEIEARWVITGSITQIGKRISIDLKVVDVSNEREPSHIFMGAEDIAFLRDTAERIAAGVDPQISGVTQVESVQVRGNQRIEKEAILAVVSTKKGDRLDYERLDKDLRDIYKMGFFKDVQIESGDGPNGKIITFNVVEKPSIGKIVFEGNEEIEEDELNQELGIKLYSILDYNEVRQSINRLKELYRKKGFYNVEIQEEIEPLPNNEVQLKYKIEEKEPVYITEIRFLGNKQFDDDELKGIMETSESGFFSWITGSGYLDNKVLEFDTHKITFFYNNNGFIKARVGDPIISYDKTKGLTITIEIHEGKQYRIKKVSIEGDLIKPIDELKEAIQIDKESIFSREIVRKDCLALRDIYTDEGYANAEVTPVINEDDENCLVEIAYKIFKGEKVFFERINISGNTTTRDKVIRRELKVVEGEYFNGEALRRSELNLNRLGFFEDVELRTRKGSKEDRTVLDIRVKERPTGNFSFGGGYSSVDKVVGTVQIAQNNFMGRGQRLSTSAKIGGSSSEFDISFTEPWLFDTPISGSAQVYKWKREYDEYTKDSLGGTLAIGFPIDQIDDFTRGWVQYSYDDADISDIGSDASLLIRAMEGRSISSSVTIGLRRNSTDRAWNPTMGSINSISFEYAGGMLGGDNYFNKYNAQSAWFFPLFWDTVFMAQGRWGYLQGRSGGALPVYEKFYLGGINTVRGFEYAAISPLDPETGDKIGGEKMMVYNLEYRVPLLKEQGIIGLAFFDAGNVFRSEDSYTFSGIREGAGGGIRWYSPMGPLRLEWGRNLDPRRGEPSSRIEFSIGGMF